MNKISMESLEKHFEVAVQNGENFVAIEVTMNGFPKPEVIVNPIENAKDKIEYYKKTYDGKLNHRFADGIKITGFASGKSMEELEEDLMEF